MQTVEFVAWSSRRGILQFSYVLI